MKQFTYVITEEAGIHARPAGLLVKEAAKFASSTTIAKGAKKGEEITVTCEGADEDAAAAALEAFFQANL